MKKIYVIILFGLLSFPLFAQTVESAVKRMNMGDYVSAKAYWEALSDRKNNYGSQIAICNTCIKLQKEAESMIAAERYTKAIEKYQAILSKNSSDQNAKQKIEYCRRLRDEYLAANELQTYTNYTYGYMFKYPTFLTKGTTSTNEKPVFWSSDFNIRVDLSTTIHKNSLTNTQILSKVAESYKGAEVTYKVIKENWIVISGYQSNGLTFYEKAIISTRKSQYNEPVKILVSAVVKSPKNDTRGSKIADCISENLTVNATGNSITVTETDDERWQRAKRTDTKEGYSNYLAYAPTYLSHKDEATKRKALCEAREDYSRGLYLSAKKNFEIAEQYLTSADRSKYEDAFYRYCVNYCNSVEELQKFSRIFPTHPQMKVIKGCYVKLYCSRGLYSAAKTYVKNNYGVWFNETTPYSQKQWLKYIKDHSKKKTTTKTSTTTSKQVSNTVSAGMNFTSSGSYGSYKKKNYNIGYTFGVGTELSFPGLYVGAFPQIKVSGGLGDNWNRFNLLADLTIGYSGDFGSTFKATLAPRWNILADDFYIYAQPEVGYDFFQRGAVYGGRIGLGLDYLGGISVGYLHSEGFGGGLWQLSYVYNWYW